jgi:hypothetical protein
MSIIPFCFFVKREKLAEILDQKIVIFVQRQDKPGIYAAPVHATGKI